MKYIMSPTSNMNMLFPSYSNRALYQKSRGTPLLKTKSYPMCFCRTGELNGVLRDESLVCFDEDMM